MKKIWIVLLMVSVLLTSCGNKGQGKNRNVLGGTGKLHNVKNMFCDGEMYDDENIYFLVYLNSALSGPPCSYVKLTKDERVLANCNIPTCTHVNYEKCEARAFYHYFEFGEKLYKFVQGGEMIYEGDKGSEKCVYVQRKPEELKDDNALVDVGYVVVLDEKYAVIVSNHFAHIVDTSMKVVYSITDLGKYQFEKLYNDHIYYVNNLEQLVEIDTVTWEAKVIETENFITHPADDACQTTEYFFYITPTYKLHRYSVETGEDLLLNEDFDSYFIGVYNGCLYSQRGNFKNTKKMIYDFDGNFVKDISDYDYLVMDRLAYINGRLYSNFTLGFGTDGFVISSINPDGSDYREYWMED